MTKEWKLAHSHTHTGKALHRDRVHLGFIYVHCTIVMVCAPSGQAVHF
jgi:hypothetical protein